jgi:hypothetical protein
MEGNTPDYNQPDQFIRLSCGSCGRNIRVPKSFAGRQGKCPKCNNVFIISTLVASAPSQEDEPIRMKRDYDLSTESDRPIYKAPDLPHRMAPEPVAEGPGKLPEAEPAKEPATFLDVLAFPFSLSGVIHLIIFSFAPLVIFFFQLTLFTFCCYGQFVGIGAIILLASYFYYYLIQCVIAAAKDERRAPDVSNEDIPTFGDLIRRLLLFVSSSVICFLPAIIYIIDDLFIGFTGQMRAVEPPPIMNIWCLVGVFFFPMFLLAVAMFDSLMALNPILIISSIFSTFLPYCGLAILFFGIGFLLYFIAGMQQYLAFFIWVCDVYVIFVAAYILGCFYRRYEDRLNWEVKL